MLIPRFAIASTAILLLACGKPAESPSSEPPSSTGGTPGIQPSEHGESMAHETKHAGVLKMSTVNGVHLHTEVVVHPDGKVSLFMSDANGVSISPNDVSGNVMCERDDTHEKATLALKANATEGGVEAQCAALAAPMTTVSYDLKVRATALSQSLKVPPGGTAALADDHGSEHHREHGHSH
jgi:hypothetical protein